MISTPTQITFFQEAIPHLDCTEDHSENTLGYETTGSATYKVAYKLGIDGAIGQYYRATSAVALVKKNGKWLVSGVTNDLGDNKKYTFVSRLQFLDKQIDPPAQGR